MIAAIADHPRHTFWPDSLSYRAVSMGGVIGHREVTDAYLAAPARTDGGRLATFDGGLAALHGDVADLVPSHGAACRRRSLNTEASPGASGLTRTSIALIDHLRSLDKRLTGSNQRGSGVVVLPPGSGKTMVGLVAMA